MRLSDRILITGSTGLAGSAILRALFSKGFTNIIATYNKRQPDNCFGPDILGSIHCKFIKIDLLDGNAVQKLFVTFLPEYVFLAAAKVGGIMANYKYRAEFIYENLQIQNNIIHNSYVNNIKKLIFLGSTCIYPTNAPQPMNETCLMTDTLEYLSEPYGVAKIAGIKMCESYNIQYGTNYIAVMPTNLYGPNDNYNLENSHFLPAFIRKIHLGKSLMENNWEAIYDDFNKNPVEGVNGESSKQEIADALKKYGIQQSGNGNHVSIILWGTGKPRREVLHSDELAEACLHVMENINFSDLRAAGSLQYSTGVVQDEIRNTQVNIGLGVDYSLYEIAMMVKEIESFEGEIIWDRNMPDGTFQKLTDVNKMTKLGWKSKINLREGILETYRSYATGPYIKVF